MRLARCVVMCRPRAAPSPLLARALAPWVAPAADWDAETQTAYGSVRLRDDARFQRTFSGVGGVPEQADDGQAKAAAPLGAVGGKAFHLLYEEYPPYRPFLGTGRGRGAAKASRAGAGRRLLAPVGC